MKIFLGLAALWTIAVACVTGVLLSGVIAGEMLQRQRDALWVDQHCHISAVYTCDPQVDRMPQ